MTKHEVQKPLHLLRGFLGAMNRDEDIGTRERVSDELPVRAILFVIVPLDQRVSLGKRIVRPCTWMCVSDGSG